MQKHVYHGKSNTPLYMVYDAMKQRCRNANSMNYKHYGARGISVCSLWILSYNNFYNWAIKSGYKKGLTIERKNNDKGYSPSNCKWITQQEQLHNRRDYKNNKSGYNGVCWGKRENKWRATILHHKKQIYVGTYVYALDAAKARDAYITENNLPHKLNLLGE